MLYLYPERIENEPPGAAMRTPSWIRAQLKLRDIAIQAIAREAGVSGPVVHRAISRDGRSKTAETAVAMAIGLSRLEVFGPNKWELATRAVAADAA